MAASGVPKDADFLQGREGEVHVYIRLDHGADVRVLVSWFDVA